MKDEPNKITATLRAVIAGEFYDDEASEETLRYCVEQDLEDAGFDVDVTLLKEQEAVKPKSKSRHGEYPQIVHRCGNCNEILYRHYKHCPTCGRSVKWE